MKETDYPHLTVATVIEDAGRFLLVEEHADGALVINQPAGHVEPGESLIQAARRETLEETGWEVQLTALLGSSSYRASNGVSYCRISFAGRPVRQLHPQPPDEDIKACHWLTEAEIRSLSARMRSPLVESTLERFLDGRYFPLDFLY